MTEALSYLGVFGDDGKFHPDSPNAFRAGAKAFTGKRTKVTLELPKETRSDRQNRFLYGVVVRAFCEYMGYRFNSTADKEYVKREILLEVGHYDLKRSLDGTERREPKPTRKMDKQTFGDLCAALQQMGAEYGIVIPDPESPQAMAAKV